MKKVLLLILFISFYFSLSADYNLKKQDIKRILSQELKEETTQEKTNLQLLQNMGKSLQTYSILTYSGLILSVIGGLIYQDETELGAGFMITGGIVSLIAPSLIAKSGRQIQDYADNELMRLKNYRNHSINELVTPEITTPKNNEVFFVGEFVNIKIIGDRIKNVYCWSNLDDADVKYLIDNVPPWNFIKKFGHTDIGNVTVYCQVNLTNDKSKNLQVTFKIIQKE